MQIKNIPFNNWYSSLVSTVKISATEKIFSSFENARFVVIAQKKTKTKIQRRIAFLVGPYVICEAVNELKLNDFVEDWTTNKPNIPLGKMISMAKQKRVLVKKGKNFRKYKIIGQVDAVVKETFYGLDQITIGAYCGTILNTYQDIVNAEKFASSDKYDVTLFPESYPFSRRKLDFSNFPEGSILGCYSSYGPKMFFLSKNHKLINKSTFFANEKILSKRKFLPNIFNIKNKKVAVLICYDTMNPKLSFYLSKKEIDLMLVSAMIPKTDIERWKKFAYVRGNENQCPVVIVSAKDKRKITAPFVIYYNPISDEVIVYNKPKKLNLYIGTRLLESPKTHWSWLLKNGAFGPFLRDF
ncbi:MAG: hypothetical protein WC821_04385 [archaeon]|jgi:hypothetical protein